MHTCEESARCLRESFRAVLGGDAVEITVGENVSAVQGAARMALQLDAHPAQIKRQDHNVMTHAEMYLSSRALVSSWLYWRTGERDPLSLGPSRLQQSVLASWAAHNEVTVQTRSSRREYMKNVVSVDKNG